MKAVFSTKSNYKNANNKYLEVVEIHLTRISCKVPEYGFSKDGEPQGKFITADFYVKELVQFDASNTF